MEDGIIYTFGSLDTLVMILEGLAVLFDPLENTFFSSDSGLGVGVGGTLAAMLAVLGVFSNYFSTNKISIHGPLVGLVIYAAVAVPKIERIFVSDLYTGETVAVSDVPLGVAIIGIAMSTITYNIIEETEEAYAGTPISGTPFEAQLSEGEGFLSPMKTLFKLRENILPSVPTYLVYNIFSYSKYCVMRSINRVSPTRAAGAENFDLVTFSASELPFTLYFLNEDLIDPALTAEFKDPTTGAESFVSCEALNVSLSVDDAAGGIAFFLKDEGTFGRHLLTQLAGSDETMLANCAATGACLNNATAITKTEELVGQILGGTAQAERYIEARMAADFNRLISMSSTLNTDSLTNVASLSREAAELVRLTEVLEGETFLRFMIPAMNSFLFLFYALFPLAMVIMITKGTQSFVYLGGYLLIGVWAYSWMPVASVINYITIANVAEALNTSRNLLGINIASSPLLLERAMDQLATGSNLLAATPVITLAIISGSIFALNSAASNSASPSGSTGDIARANTPKSHTGLSLLQRNAPYSDAEGNAGAGLTNPFASKVGGTRTVAEISSSDHTRQAIEQSSLNATKNFTSASSNVLTSKFSEIARHSASQGTVSMSASTQSTIAEGSTILSSNNIDTSGLTETQLEQARYTAGLMQYLGADVSTGALNNMVGAFRDNNGAGVDGMPVAESSAGETGDNVQPNSTKPSGKGGRPVNARGGVTGTMTQTWEETDGKQISNMITGSLSTGNSIGIKNSDGTTGSQTVSNGELNTYDSAKSAEVQNLRTMAQSVQLTSAKLDAFNETQSQKSSFTQGSKYTERDLFNLLAGGNASSPQAFHQNNLAGTMREAGFSQGEIDEGFKFFESIRNTNNQSQYGGANTPDALYMSGLASYDLSNAKLVGMNSRGDTLFGDMETDQKFSQSLTAAGQKQFDFANPNQKRSEEIKGVNDGINAGENNKNFLREETEEGIHESARDVNRVTNGSGITGATIGGLTQTQKEQVTSNNIDNASSLLDSTGFKPSNSPVEGAATLKDAYFSDEAKNAYASAEYGEGNSNVGWNDLNAKQQGTLSGKMNADAMSDIASFNKRVNGYDTPQQDQLLDMQVTNAGNENRQQFELGASQQILSAVQSGTNTRQSTFKAETASKDVEQTSQGQKSARIDSMTRENSVNTHGGDGAEYGRLMMETTKNHTPQTWNSQIDSMKREALQNPVSVDGTDQDRKPGATVDFYDSMKVPEDFNGSYLQQVTNSAEKFSVLAEHDGVLASLGDEYIDRVSSTPRVRLQNAKDGDGEALNSNYSNHSVNGMFREHILEQANQKVGEINPSMQEQARREIGKAYAETSGLGGGSPADYIGAVNNILGSYKPGLKI